MRYFTILLIISLFSTFGFASDLQPLMAIPGDVVFPYNDFESGENISKTDWMPRQNTRWRVKDGVLLGMPSTAENQAAKAHHKGLEARGLAGKTPMDFIAKLSIRYMPGEETALTPFIEFGHHNCRVQFSKDTGAILLVESETKQVAASENFKFEQGKWYHLLAEMVGEEFVFQIKDGPTFYTKNASFLNAKDHFVGVAGLKGGQVEIDNFTIRRAEPSSVQSGWAERKQKFPTTTPILRQKRIDQLAKKKAVH